MDIKEHIVADAEKVFIRELQLLNVEPNAKEYDLICIYDLYSKIKCKKIKSSVTGKVQNYCI